MKRADKKVKFCICCCSSNNSSVSTEVKFINLVLLWNDDDIYSDHKAFFMRHKHYVCLDVWICPVNCPVFSKFLSCFLSCIFEKTY